jgi:hypothetical protein
VKADKLRTNDEAPVEDESVKAGQDAWTKASTALLAPLEGEVPAVCVRMVVSLLQKMVNYREDTSRKSSREIRFSGKRPEESWALQKEYFVSDFRFHHHHFESSVSHHHT